MAPLVLEGENLGQRHRHFNSLVKKAIADHTPLEPINYEDPDINNLLKIDVASSIRNVDYILQVLTSDDMLYVSRAIKQSSWLITENMYAHIINHKYLNDVLFPKMSSKAKSKFILNIRLHLRDAPRVEAFYESYADDIKTAQKWLPYCSSQFIENIIQTHTRDIEPQTLKRLCEISFDHFSIYVKAANSGYYRQGHLKPSMFLLNDYTNEYLDVIEAREGYEMPTFGRKATKIIMQKCHDRIVKSFIKYASNIHLPTFAKHLKKEAIQDFLLKQAENENMKHWMKFGNIEHFIKYLPIENRFAFIKKMFIDKEKTAAVSPYGDDVLKDDCVQIERCVQMCSMKTASSNFISTNSAHIYRWYRFAPFESAFNYLKKMIRVESNPAERNAMLTVLLHCIRCNPQHIQKILLYYRTKHINEPFQFKVQFVNTFISLNATHKLDEKTWNILNEIFNSLEVYMESANNMPYCLKAIIVYKLLHQQTVPEIVKKKHTFDTFLDYRSKLSDAEQTILFTYLYDLEFDKINLNISNEGDVYTSIGTIKNILTLVKDWKRKVDDYPKILETVKCLLKLKMEMSWKTYLSAIYLELKVLRRHLFEESLVLNPTAQACFNALKHDPGLLDRYDAEVAAMRSNDAISLKKVLSKLRIYWAQSLAIKWAEAYKDQLNESSGYKATIDGICILLPRTQCIHLLSTYSPVETKINWSNTDEVLLNIRKNIAKRMQLVRPAPKLEAVLTYAKEDYLQYALPSLNAIIYNMSSVDSSQCIQRLVNAAVSLQKHGIRLAFTKLQLSEIKELIPNIWNSSTNSSIKTVLFKKTYDLLRKEKNETNIKEIWAILSSFIDKLTQEEDRIIYITLRDVANVPLIVRPQYLIKSYLYLASLPTKANCASMLKILDYQVVDFVELLESDFVEDVLLKSMDLAYNQLMTESNLYDKIMTKFKLICAYILTAKNEKTQYQRYEKLLHPFLASCFKSWGDKIDNQYPARHYCKVILDHLLHCLTIKALKTSVVSVSIFKDIQTSMITALAIEENYAILSYWNITVMFVESIASFLKDLAKTSCTAEKAGPSEMYFSNMLRRPQPDYYQNYGKEWEKACTKIAPEFGEACLKFLKTDISFKNTSTFTVFARLLCEVFSNVGFDYDHQLQTLKPMLTDRNVTVCYLVALEVLRPIQAFNNKTVRDLKIYVLNAIKSHPSTEVQIFYYEYKNYNPFQPATRVMSFFNYYI